MSTTTRFAPSPTGLLHLGHVYAAMAAQRRARLGLAGDGPLRVQSAHLAEYGAVLDAIRSLRHAGHGAEAVPALADAAPLCKPEAAN